MNEKERRKLRKFVIFRPAQDLSRMFAGQSSTHETNSLHWPLTYAESKVLCNYETDQAELSKETVTRIIHQDSTLHAPRETVYDHHYRMLKQTVSSSTAEDRFSISCTHLIYQSCD